MINTMYRPRNLPLFLCAVSPWRRLVGLFMLSCVHVVLYAEFGGTFRDDLGLAEVLDSEGNFKFLGC